MKTELKYLSSRVAWALYGGLVVALLSGCAQLGITSSIRTTFEESEEEGVQLTTWTMWVRNGIWSTINEEVMKTTYQIDENGVQTITQGSRVSGMDSSGQIEGVKMLGNAVSKVLVPIPDINPAAADYFKP